MTQFLQQNLVLAVYILVVLGAFAFYYFVRFKPEMDEAAEKSGYDFWGKIFGKYSRIILFLLFFIGMPLFAYFVLTPMFSVDTTNIETVAQAQEYAQNNTNFLTPLWEKINGFGGSIIEKGQQNQAIGGLIILLCGIILLIGIIVDADWVLESNSRGSFNFLLRVLTDSGNRNKARLLMLIPTTALIFVGLLLIFGHFAFG